MKHAQFLLLSALALASAAETVAVVSTEGHGCCQTPTPPCWPLTIIKQCGEPSPSLHSYNEAAIAISAIAAALAGTFLAVRRQLKKMDFYLVR